MKCTWKLTPVSPYDVQGLESWLQDMALHGLYLKKFRPLFCTFVQEPARRTRYRIEPHHRPVDGDLPQSMLELYQSYGWECVGEVNRELLIFATQDEDAPELHTDPELQGELWRKLSRRLGRNLAGSIVWLALLGGLTLFLLFWAGHPLLTLLTTAMPAVVLYFLYTLACLPSRCLQFLSVSRFTRQLEAGEAPSHREVYPRRRIRELVSLAVNCVLLIFLVTSYILAHTGNHMQPVEAAEAAFSPLSLSELEGEDYRPDTVFLGDTDYGNFSRKEREILSTQWEVVQSGTWAPEGEEWVRLELLWYDLPAPLSFLSVPAARELLDGAMELDDDIWWKSGEPVTWDVTYFPQDGLQLLAVARRAGGTFQAAAAAAGDKAVLVRYTGHGDLADHLEAIAAMVR